MSGLAFSSISPWRWRLVVAVTGLWWSSLLLLGAVVVPLLFQHLPTPSQAGQLAARLFAAQTWVSVACAISVLLLLTRRDTESPLPASSMGASMAVVGGLLCAMLIEFAVAPRILAGEDRRFWHAVGTALFAAQGLLALAAWWSCLNLARPEPSQSD